MDTLEMIQRKRSAWWFEGVAVVVIVGGGQERGAFGGMWEYRDTRFPWGFGGESGLLG